MAPSRASLAETIDQPKIDAGGGGGREGAAVKTVKHTIVALVENKPASWTHRQQAA